MRVVITGANRGIGLALAKLFSERGDEVHATAREPEKANELNGLKNVVVHQLDVASDESCAALGRDLAALKTLDVLVNNAGIGAWEKLDAFDPKQALALIDTNAIGAMRVTRALLPLLEASKGKIFNMSSGMGSITETSSGGAYAYRMSKAALGMASKTLSVDLKDKGVASIVIEPGWVSTDMGGKNATLTPEECAKQLGAIITSRGIESTGKFFTRKNAEMPW